MDRYLAANPRTDGLRDWASVVTQYRSATIHEGYVDFEKKDDISDVASVCNHLEDVIARLILKQVGYDGTYDSPLLRNFGPQTVAWVEKRRNRAFWDWVCSSCLYELQLVVGVTVIRRRNTVIILAEQFDFPVRHQGLTRCVHGISKSS